ncbi:hypothetical protein MMC11_007286 [Xylographa trunciseda]|nr:hypothetical protein [Xylographa trunciseda]
MATNEAYMLQRDSLESKRLDAQHEYMRALSSGHLIHPSIPSSVIRAVADVGAGTGAWLRDVANSAAIADDKEATFVGFDISPQQFPPVETVPANVKFVVHDITKPFPVEYHEAYDLVNVRLLSYAIRAVDLEKTVQHVLRILRPGGYLQWQECDACDSWTSPETAMATSTINYVVAEKIARGLLPGIATPLLKTIQSQTLTLSEGQLNPISRSPELTRIMNLETVSTRNHSSPAIARGKKAGIQTAAVALLQAGVNRRKALVENSSLPKSEAEKLAKEKQEIEELIDAVKRGDNEVSDNWDMEMTWIVARKAIIVNEGEAWMSAKYPS